MRVGFVLITSGFMFTTSTTGLRKENNLSLNIPIFENTIEDHMPQEYDVINRAHIDSTSPLSKRRILSLTSTVNDKNGEEIGRYTLDSNIWGTNLKVSFCYSNEQEFNVDDFEGFSQYETKYEYLKNNYYEQNCIDFKKIKPDNLEEILNEISLITFRSMN